MIGARMLEVVPRRWIDDTDQCNVEAPSGERCAKPAGHDGRHAACSITVTDVTRWTDEPADDVSRGDPDGCLDPTHDADCDCGANPDRAYEQGVEAEQ